MGGCDCVVGRRGIGRKFHKGKSVQNDLHIGNVTEPLGGGEHINVENLCDYLESSFWTIK